MTIISVLGCAVCVGLFRLNLGLLKTPSIPTVFDNPMAFYATGPKVHPGPSGAIPETIRDPNSSSRTFALANRSGIHFKN